MLADPRVGVVHGPPPSVGAVNNAGPPAWFAVAPAGAVELAARSATTRLSAVGTVGAGQPSIRFPVRSAL
jgi:hypothetical protein